MSTTRRDVIRGMAASAAGLALLGSKALAQPAAGGAGKPSASPHPDPPENTPLFTISLAQWSLHKALQQKQLDPMDFPRVAKQEYGIDAVEYVNSFYKGLVASPTLGKDLRTRCEDAGVASVLIMCDGEGALGDADEKKRLQAVDNHKKWAALAKELGCHSIRVNAQSSGTREEQMNLAADGLRRLSEHCDTLGLNCIVENHGGLSSHGDWLVGVMKKVGHPRCGTLPDFGNFYEYDRYQGVKDMMPFAKGVSAKSHDFDAEGNETRTDYVRMLQIVLDAGYKGRVGIEYEGERLPEPEGIRATKRLLEKVRDRLAKPKAGEPGR